ncbi:multicopper oxidase [Acrodontium crateriforme]|uniref:Multicopper oxidase n=1 Tax=Acrodontium crateriforme TaxID=150365 RepID=A0AAQ3LZK7_9PEZI|nr:multicopper oxidase [Acrodontium crateriforme]
MYCSRALSLALALFCIPTYAAVRSVNVTTATQGDLSENQYYSAAWIPHGSDLNPHLPQWTTNGNSPLGTLRAPQLPPWLSGSPMPQGRPWGNKTSANTNYYTDPPFTGVTRHYNFVVSKQKISPDGVEVDGIVINGAFPGPTIEANWGDWIEVKVDNHLENEGTSLHWHGLLQKETPWMDGVPGVMQCPIAPGSSFTYRFRADLYGTSWYHSHFSAQYAAGAIGAMVIYGPRNADYDIDLGPVILTDWYHDYYYNNLEKVMAPTAVPGPPPPSNNNLINGKMNYPCVNTTSKCTPNAGVSKFHFTPGKKYLLRLINAGAEGMQKFSIDNHDMIVTANDFVQVDPYGATVITLGVGQRTDIIVEAKGKSNDAVWMRSTLGPSFLVGGCAVNDGISPEAVAAIYYDKANTTAVPQSVSTVPASLITTCQNDALDETEPYYPITPPPNPDTTQQVDVNFKSNGTHWLWYMNNSTFRVDYNDPILLDAKLGNINFPSKYNVYNFGRSKSIRIVLYNHVAAGAHPFHMHGHNMYILASGTGTWDGQVTRPSNPQRRDVQILPNAVGSQPSYIVIQIDGDNPGIWPFHCHIAWHVSGGLYMNIMENPKAIQMDVPIPYVMAQTCRDWTAWTGDHIPDQIDSGL